MNHEMDYVDRKREFKRVEREKEIERERERDT